MCAHVIKSACACVYRCVCACCVLISLPCCPIRSFVLCSSRFAGTRACRAACGFICSHFACRRAVQPGANGHIPALRKQGHAASGHVRTDAVRLGQPLLPPNLLSASSFSLPFTICCLSLPSLVVPHSWHVVCACACAHVCVHVCVRMCACVQCMHVCWCVHARVL